MTTETVIYRIEIPVEDMEEGLPKKLNQFLKQQEYPFEIIDSEGFDN